MGHRGSSVVAGTPLTELRVGMLVRTKFNGPEEEAIVRKVISVHRSTVHQSGFVASADAGQLCPTCGVAPGQNVPPIDASWFVPVEGP